MGWNVVVLLVLALSVWVGWSGVLADFFLRSGPTDGLSGMMSQLMGVMLRGPFGAIWAGVAAWHVLFGIRTIVD